MPKGKRVSVILSTILVVMLSTIVFAANGFADSSSDDVNPVVPISKKPPGYPTAIPPDTKPKLDTDQDSKMVIKSKKGEHGGSKGCLTTWDWGYWSQPQKQGNDAVSYGYTYAGTTCWQNPITRVQCKAILWKWVNDEWIEVAREDNSRNYAGQENSYPTYENAETAYYCQTSYHYAKQGVWPILSEWEESDYVALYF